MALYLQVSNSLYQLAKKLCNDLRSKQYHVFQPYYIVTQTEGMNNWLKLQMAEQLGIAANYQFLTPNEVIYEIYRALGGRYSQVLAPQNLSWIFYKLLSEREFTERFPEVASYYGSGSDKDVKRLALAEKVADLFDQYQIYRPEMISEWSRRGTDGLERGEWQRFLWVRAKDLTQDSVPDKTLIGQFILEQLKHPEAVGELKKRMPFVHIFGLSVITRYHLQLFSEAGRHIDFFFHILNPAPLEYWFEDRSEKQMLILKKKGLADSGETALGNALLTSWGRLIGNTFSLFFENEDLINAYEEAGIDVPGDETLLQTIQQDIFYNRGNDERQALSTGRISDGSVTVNSCYTPAREVEVLYNYLVYLADQKKESLSARDIVVMVSDIDTYAPYIRAVFNNAPYSFHYTIADESFIADDSLANALQSVLRINRMNFKAEEVLQLLDSSFIRRRFSISDLPLIRKVVDLAGIRFGLEGSSDDDTRYVSWHYGLERIMYGICMAGGEEFKNEEGETLYPLDAVEGHASAEVIKFCHFVMVLSDSVRERDRDRTLPEWVSYIESVLHDLVAEQADDADDEYSVLLKHLENYNSLNELLNEKLSYEVFIHSFLQSLSGSARTGSFAGGGITFCSLIPMRSIPFKVVALLGLNFDAFPRKEKPSGFNLMEREKRKGDRNMKENDKHLFLETVLSAQKYLYISYIGQSVKDNTVMPPSTLVDELIDYVLAASADGQDRDILVTRHPLHSFSARYRRGEARLYNYLEDRQEGETAFLIPGSNGKDLNLEEISPRSFTAFFRNPFKSYYNQVLGINYRTEDVLLSDTELFELDSIQKWELKQELLKKEFLEIGTLKDELLKKGQLPLKNMGGLVLKKLEAEVLPVKELFKHCSQGLEEQPAEVEIRIGKNQIKGAVGSLYGNRLIYISWSKNELKYLQDLYITSLMLAASGIPADIYFISAVKGKIYQPVSLLQEESLSRLGDLMELYKLGHEHILAFYPDFNIEPSKAGQLNQNSFKSIVARKLGDYQNPCTDRYIMNEFRKGYFNSYNVFEEYMEAARKLLVPLPEFIPSYFN